MTAKEVFKKTRPFVVAKLAIGGATVLISLVLFAIIMGLGWLFGKGAMGAAVLVWLAATGLVRFLLMQYIGYLVKAGHIAVIAEAITTGNIPANQVEYGKNMVTQRFGTTNVYFAVDKLVTAAVKQIQRGIQKLGNAMDFIPGIGAVTGIANFFVSISLGYIDECCLGYTFIKKDQGPFKSSADGVVIYAQNWKILLKSAAMTTAKTLGLLVVLVLVVFVPVGLLFKILNWSGFVAFLMACLIVWVLKFAYIDSYILCQTMANYMEIAPSTTITYDLYGQLSNMSSSFKELFAKAQQEEPSSSFTPIVETNASIFCGECGEKMPSEGRFCGNCGADIHVQSQFSTVGDE